MVFGRQSRVGCAWPAAPGRRPGEHLSAAGEAWLALREGSACAPSARRAGQVGASGREDAGQEAVVRAVGWGPEGLESHRSGVPRVKELGRPSWDGGRTQDLLSQVVSVATCCDSERACGLQSVSSGASRVG